MNKLSLANLYIPAYNGLTLGFGPEVAGVSNVFANIAAQNTEFAKNYAQGKEAYARELEQVRGENPGISFVLEMGGCALTGGMLAKLLKKGLGVANALRTAKKVYPHRSREQWQKDLAYGREEFNKLRDLGPLKREGHPNAYVTAKHSWPKIRHGNIPEKYDMLRDAPDIYATGEYTGPTPAEEGHKHGFDQFHWFEKNNKGLQVGENVRGRMLYNVNPNVKQFLLEHPEKAEQLGIDISKL